MLALIPYRLLHSLVPRPSSCSVEGGLGTRLAEPCTESDLKCFSSYSTDKYCESLRTSDQENNVHVHMGPVQYAVVAERNLIMTYIWEGSISGECLQLHAVVGLVHICSYTSSSAQQGGLFPNPPPLYCASIEELDKSL